VFAALALLWGGIHVLTGFALRSHRHWARLVGMALAVLNLFFLPFGTALAVYTFWTLLSDETRKLFDPAHQAALQRLAECAEFLGFDIHVQTDYGDEFRGLTPWELFDAQEAGEAVGIAEEAVRLAQAVVQAVLP